MIYVSAASSELERAEAFMRAARRRGIMISLDWTPFFRRAQAGEHVDPAECVAADITGVLDADTLVALLPTEGRTSRGLWVEVGAALTSDVEIVFVGREGDADIWGCAGTFVDTDAEALDLLERAERGLEGLRS